MLETTGWRERFESYALLWGLLVVVGVLSLLPLVRLLVEGVAPQGSLSASAITRVLSSSATWTATQHSLVTALGGTILALVIGSVVALVVGLTNIRHRNAFVFCFVLPMMIAPQVVALAWLQLSDRRARCSKRSVSRKRSVAAIRSTRRKESSSFSAYSTRRSSFSRCARDSGRCQAR